MARQETIRIYRSDVAGATPSLTAGEIAVNLQDGKLFVGGTNGTATDLLFLDQSQQITVKGTQGTLQFANTAITDLQSDNGLKFNFLTDNSVEMPASLRIAQVSDGWIEFGDGTTQGTAFSSIGVTFTGTVTANLFVGTVSGGSF
jgi:hypothetical protein